MGNGDAPIVLVQCNARRTSFTYFVTDDTADGSAADRSDRAAPRQDGTSDCTDSGANCGVLILPRHPGASSQPEHQGGGYCTDGISLDHRFHGFTSFKHRASGASNLIFRL